MVFVRLRVALLRFHEPHPIQLSGGGEPILFLFAVTGRDMDVVRQNRSGDCLLRLHGAQLQSQSERGRRTTRAGAQSRFFSILAGKCHSARAARRSSPHVRWPARALRTAHPANVSRRRRMPADTRRSRGRVRSRDDQNSGGDPGRKPPAPHIAGPKRYLQTIRTKP